MRVGFFPKLHMCGGQFHGFDPIYNWFLCQVFVSRHCYMLAAVLHMVDDKKWTEAQTRGLLSALKFVEKGWKM